MVKRSNLLLFRITEARSLSGMDLKTSIQKSLQRTNLRKAIISRKKELLLKRKLNTTSKTLTLIYNKLSIKTRVNNKNIATSFRKVVKVRYQQMKNMETIKYR